LYLIFLERYKKLLAKGGKLGVIIPNTWLQSITFRNIRRYLVNEYYWERILHINQHIFKAVVDTHVLIFERNNYVKNSEVTIDIYENNGIRFHQYISQLQLSDNGEVINILASDDEKTLFEKIKQQSIFIKDICFSTQGVKPFQVGKGVPKQTRKIVDSKPFVAEKQPKPDGKNWMPLLRGSLMNKYVNFWNNNSWIQYGEWLAEPRKPDIFETEEKIVVRQTGDSIIATIINANIICRDNLYIITSKKINLKFLLGIINSKLVDFYYCQMNPEKGEVLAQVKKQHVEQLPIPKYVSKERETEIIKLVDQLLQFNKDLQTTTLPEKAEQLKQRIEYNEDQINEIVYELYGLTEEEVKIIGTK
ncbi:MAG: endonuclease, partial [Firmicutes bacterium]|nr:endonuclease [Bacillota bacterium]